MTGMIVLKPYLCRSQGTYTIWDKVNVTNATLYHHLLLWRKASSYYLVQRSRIDGNGVGLVRYVSREIVGLYSLFSMYWLCLSPSFNLSVFHDDCTQIVQGACVRIVKFGIISNPSKSEIKLSRLTESLHRRRRSEWVSRWVSEWMDDV